VVAKFAQPFVGGDRDGFLREEALAYHFLAATGFAFGPTLLADGTGFMVLSDLGEGAREFGDTETAERAVARTLASLHICTFGQKTAYRELRAAHHLPPAPLSDHVARAADRRQLGAQFLERHLGDVAPDCLPHLHPCLETANELAHDAGASFIHDDFASGRQATILGGDVYLLDFERAHFAHPLCDVARIMLGEIVEQIDDHSHYSVLDFSHAFLDHYIGACFADGFEMSDWEDDFAFLALRITCELIGSAAQAAHGEALQLSFAEALAQVLHQTTQVLAPLTLRNPGLITLRAAIEPQT
jgi:aminoglycoside phosphotransferase (APT) family kinase protein